MVNYLSILAETIRTNWDQPALTDFYLTEDGTAQDTTRGNHYTYGEMYAEICRVAELLTALGLQKGDHIAICGANSVHWVIAYLAVAKMQGVSVTVMHSIQPDEIARLVIFSDAKLLFTDPDLWSELQIANRKSLIENQECDLSVAISLSDWSILHSICSQSRRSTDGQPTVSYNVIATHSKENLLDELVNGNWTNGICLDDLAMICFTSGTSGKAKGVMLPYRAISSNIGYQYDFLFQFHAKNTISFLPLGHILGCVDECLRNVCLGTHINIICQSIVQIDTLPLCYKIIEPCYVVLVPALLEKIMRSAHKYLNPSEKYNYIKKEFGKEIKYIFIGAAGLSSQTEKELQDLNLPILRGYGATECAPSIANSITFQQKLGSVGVPVANNKVRISPAGEILVKGENVMLGYYKDPEATAAKIDSDGWLHTGDKGHLDEDGYLYVEGRLEQDIIVLPNGENIRPDNIEALINALPEVSESIVLARDGKLVAIAVLSSPSLQGRDRVRLSILRTVNPQLPLFSQLYDVEITDQPLARTEKQTLKRYLYS